MNAVASRLPNLVIAGVNKAATTSLFMYLSAHPEVCPSRIKEVQYFLPLRYGAKELRPIEEYLQYFDPCPDAKYVMEATGGYYYGGYTVARAIKETLGDVKVILMFRDPITRLFSFYKFKKSMLELDQDLSFDDYIRRCHSLSSDEVRRRENNVYWGIEGGFYADYLDDWFDCFGDQDLRIFFFEELKRDPEGFLTNVCRWLNLEYARFANSLEMSVENKTVNYKNQLLQQLALTVNWKAERFWRSHPQLKRTLRRLYYAINGTPHQEHVSPEARAYLESLFRPYNRRLALQLSQHGYTHLPEWLAQELDEQAAEFAPES